MKYLFALALLALLLALAYRRARPYVAAARRFLDLFRDARRLTSNDPVATAQRRPGRAGEKLARCAACGTWLPASRALTLRNSPDPYCSAACLAGGADARAARGKSAT